MNVCFNSNYPSLGKSLNGKHGLDNSMKKEGGSNSVNSSNSSASSSLSSSPNWSIQLNPNPNNTAPMSATSYLMNPSLLFSPNFANFILPSAANNVLANDFSGELLNFTDKNNNNGDLSDKNSGNQFGLMQQQLQLQMALALAASSGNGQFQSKFISAFLSPTAYQMATTYMCN